MGKTRDAYFEQNGLEFIFGTNKIEKRVKLTQQGEFICQGILNKITQKWILQDNDIVSDEFSIKIIIQGEKINLISGKKGAWNFLGTEEKILSQGELEAVITLQNQFLIVKRHYVLYPDMPIIQEWTEYENVSSSEIKLNSPDIFLLRMPGGGLPDKEFAYMTGGANFTGSQIFKTIDVTDGFIKEFDSQKDPEVIEVDGLKENVWHPRLNGAGVWNEFFVLDDKRAQEGYFITFDYQGCWKARICDCDNVTSFSIWCNLIDYPLQSGETLRIPPCTYGFYQGDFDELGITINNYEYTYKWDYTREKYFNKSSLAIWACAPLTDKVFEMVREASYMGYERIWVDDFWFDAKGNWNGIFGDDWNEICRYIKECGMVFRLWMPPWHADRLSQVWLDHPEWMLDFHGNWYNWTIDMSREEAYQWILNMLHEKQEEFGSYDLRVDGDPCNLKGNDTFDSNTQNGDWNCTLKQSENFYRLYKEFKDQNPEAGLDGCSSGGHTLGIESSRYVDSQQITDGRCMHIGGYWTSMLLPIDKHQNMQISNIFRADMWNNPDHVYPDLFCAPVDMIQHPEEGVVQECMEKKREQLELFRWLRQQGIFGRYIKVYRPMVEYTDPTFIMQRMTWDNHKGLIMISCDENNPIWGIREIIYIKGLNEDEDYYIDSENGAVSAQTKTGKEWMATGIEVNNAKPGEYIYINLPDRPGVISGKEKDMINAPVHAEKRREMWLRRDGIGIHWKVNQSLKNISYYEIYRNGVLCTKVSTGTFFFDTKGKLEDNYEVKAVGYYGERSKACKVE